MANAMGRRLNYVTCWQLELQKGISGSKARNTHRSILGKSLRSKNLYLSSQGRMHWQVWGRRVIIE